MNIFVLDYDPAVAARYHCDKHVVKMITETAQLLSTAMHERGCAFTDFYRPTHVNHPCAVWVRETRTNFLWALQLLRSLLAEYDERFGRPEKFRRARGMVLLFALGAVHVPDGPLTPFALAMPEEHRSEDAVASYRSYYLTKDFATWKTSPPPWASSTSPTTT